MFLVIFSTFLLILVTSFSMGNVKVMYFSVFSPEHVNCFLISSFFNFDDKMIIIVVKL